MTDAELARGNTLLRALPTAELEPFLDVLEPVEYDLRELVYDVNQRIAFVLFPVDAVISLLTPMEDGRQVEVATIGNEGIVGIPLFLRGAFTSAHRAMSQVVGTTLRCDADAFIEHVDASPALSAIVHRYTLALLTQISQASACNRLHTLRERCARWILMTHDRASRDTFELTQEFLGQMLGVRRAGVNEVQRQLSEGGYIAYSRGSLTVLDRPGLEAQACECYRIIRAEHERLAQLQPD